MNGSNAAPPSRVALLVQSSGGGVMRWLAVVLVACGGVESATVECDGGATTLVEVPGWTEGECFISATTEAGDELATDDTTIGGGIVACDGYSGLVDVTWEPCE